MRKMHYYSPAEDKLILENVKKYVTNINYSFKISSLRIGVTQKSVKNRYYNVLNFQSFFGRTNFDVLNKYLFTFSLRADASSLFREDKRWGYFPAAAVAWKLKEESFLADSKLVNDLKLRLSWGKTGQQDITGLGGGFYPSSPLFEIGGATSQYLQGVSLYSARAFNPDLTWEKSTTYNAGLDFEFFKNNKYKIFKKNVYF